MFISFSCVHCVINTGQHLRKTQIFAPIVLFFGPADPLHGSDNFEKMTDGSRKVSFIPIGHLLVCLS